MWGGTMMALNRKQKLAAEIAAAEPELSGAKIAERVSVDVNTFYRWKKNPEWVEYLHTCCQERFRDIEKIAVNKLKENAAKGSQKAIEYVLNYLGYQPEQRIDVRNSDININITGDDD